MHILDLILHLDKYLLEAVNLYHNYFYLLFFIVIFCETGLVVTPFLPGDSLLFVAGGLAGIGQLNFTILIIVVFLAAFLGDNTNFFIGKFLGENLFKNPKSKIFRHDILEKTHAFYEKNGAKTIIMARFIPLIRTFAPFVAGLGYMNYLRFISYSVVASFSWVVLFLAGGYFFGNIAWVRAHLSLIILVVMVISVLPVVSSVIQQTKK